MPLNDIYIVGESYVDVYYFTRDVCEYGRGIVKASNGDLYCVFVDEQTYSSYPINDDIAICIGKSVDNGVTWSNSVIIIGDVVYPQIAIDSLDNIYIVYSDWVVKNICCIKGTGSSWGSPVIVGQSRSYGDIAIDGNDNIHISYTTQYPYPSNQDCMYAFSSNGGSSFNSIAMFNNMYTSALCVDLNNNVHYISGTNYTKLDYLTGIWSSSETLPTYTGGSGGIIVVDSSNNPHIITTDGDSVYVVDKIENVWVETVLEPISGEWFLNCSMSIDSNDILYATYQCGEAADGLAYKFSTDYGVTWSSERTYIEEETSMNDNYGECDAPSAMSAVFPVINGVSTNISDEGLQLVYGYRFYNWDDNVFSGTVKYATATEGANRGDAQIFSM